MSNDQCSGIQRKRRRRSRQLRPDNRITARDRRIRHDRKIIVDRSSCRRRRRRTIQTSARPRDLHRQRRTHIGRNRCVRRIRRTRDVGVATHPLIRQHRTRRSPNTRISSQYRPHRRCRGRRHRRCRVIHHRRHRCRRVHDHQVVGAGRIQAHDRHTQNLRRNRRVLNIIAPNGPGEEISTLGQGNTARGWTSAADRGNRLIGIRAVECTGFTVIPAPQDGLARRRQRNTCACGAGGDIDRGHLLTAQRGRQLSYLGEVAPTDNSAVLFERQPRIQLAARTQSAPSRDGGDISQSRWHARHPGTAGLAPHKDRAIRPQRDNEVVADSNRCRVAEPLRDPIETAISPPHGHLPVRRDRRDIGAIAVDGGHSLGRKRGRNVF